MIGGMSKSQGSLGIKVNRGNGLMAWIRMGLAALLVLLEMPMWKVRNALTTRFVQGWMVHQMARMFSALTGVPTIRAELRAVLYRRDGTMRDYGVLSYRLVTNAFIAAVIDELDASTGIAVYNYHGVGTGTGAESAADTALGTEITTQINPDSTRATGTQTQPTASQYRTVATVAFDGTAAVTEHGVFTQAATGGGGLMDRSVFSAINVVDGDSIQFTYTYTLSGDA